MSSGGTESIILACFAHRNRARARGIENPVIVAPITAHAAFEKVTFCSNFRNKSSKFLGCQRSRHPYSLNTGRSKWTSQFEGNAQSN